MGVVFSNFHRLTPTVSLLFFCVRWGFFLLKGIGKNRRPPKNKPPRRQKPAPKKRKRRDCTVSLSPKIEAQSIMNDSARQQKKETTRGSHTWSETETRPTRRTSITKEKRKEAPKRGKREASSSSEHKVKHVHKAQNMVAPQLTCSLFSHMAKQKVCGRDQ